MSRPNDLILFRFLGGILLIQGAAAVLTYVALKSEHTEVWLVLATLALATGLVATFWFASVAGQLRKDALARLQKDFYREREQIRVTAEREKAKVIKQSHQQITKERNRAQNRANVKVGASLAVAVGLGLLMLLTQFVTIGLLTLTTAGGAVGGYLFRARRERAELPLTEPGRLATPRAPWHMRLGLLRRAGAPASGSRESPA